MAKKKMRGADFYALPKRELMLAQPPTEYFSLLEAAQLTRLSPWTLRGFIKNGHLPFIRIGRRILVTREGIRTFMDRHAGRNEEKVRPSPLKPAPKTAVYRSGDEAEGKSPPLPQAKP